MIEELNLATSKRRRQQEPASAKHPLLRLLHYGRAYRSQFWLAVLCSILNKVFDLAPPVLIGVAIDVIVNQQNSWLAQLGIADVKTQFIMLAILTVLIWVLESVFE